jgi:hypothetical protein
MKMHEEIESHYSRTLKQIDPNDIESIIKVAKKYRIHSDDIFLVPSNNCISIVSNVIAFPIDSELIEFTFDLSDYYVVTIEFYDDDLIKIALYFNGRFVTAYCDGKDYFDVGYAPQLFDSSILSKIFNVNADQIELAYSKDLYETCNNFIEIMKVPLKITIDEAKALCKQKKAVKYTFEF